MPINTLWPTQTAIDSSVGWFGKGLFYLPNHSVENQLSKEKEGCGTILDLPCASLLWL